MAGLNPPSLYQNLRYTEQGFTRAPPNVMVNMARGKNLGLSKQDSNTLISTQSGNELTTGTDGGLFVPPLGSQDLISNDAGNASRAGSDGLVFTPAPGVATVVEAQNPMSPNIVSNLVVTNGATPANRIVDTNPLMGMFDITAFNSSTHVISIAGGRVPYFPIPSPSIFATTMTVPPLVNFTLPASNQAIVVDLLSYSSDGSAAPSTPVIRVGSPSATLTSGQYMPLYSYTFTAGSYVFTDLRTRICNPPASPEAETQVNEIHTSGTPSPTNGQSTFRVSVSDRYLIVNMTQVSIVATGAATSLTWTQIPTPCGIRVQLSALPAVYGLNPLDITTLVPGRVLVVPNANPAIGDFSMTFYGPMNSGTTYIIPAQTFVLRIT